MSWQHVINGNLYSQDNFNNFNYTNSETGLPAIFGDMVEHVNNMFRFSCSEEIAYEKGEVGIKIDLNKPLQKSVSVTLAAQANDKNYISGFVKSYDSKTGALILDVTHFNGAGSNDDWIGQISSPTADDVNAVKLELERLVQAAAAYASSQGVPAELVAGGTFNIPNNTSKISLICLGTTGEVVLPVIPGVKAFYEISTTVPVENIGIKTSGGSNQHDIVRKDETAKFATIKGDYCLKLYWDGSKYLEVF